MSVHSCHAQCGEPACVVGRERDRYARRVRVLEARRAAAELVMRGSYDAASDAIERARKLQDGKEP